MGNLVREWDAGWMTFEDIAPSDAVAALQKSPALAVLDVRTAEEYQAYHVEGAILMPIQELGERTGELDPDTAYLVTCEHGMRSLAACEYLSSIGFVKLTNVSGGMAQWVGEGLPLDPR